MSGLSYNPRKPFRDEPFLTAEGGLEYRPEQQPKVPRSATLEAPHIIQAYLDGDPNAQKRIEEYGRLEREKWDALMAPFRTDYSEGRAVLYAPMLTYYDNGAPDRRKRTDKHKRAGPPEHSDHWYSRKKRRVGS